MRLSVAVVIGVLALPFSAVQARSNLSDDQVRQQMIDESIRSYSGSCPCPYNSARNGTQCGRRSAYSRPGGASPLCYPRDITDDMLRAYKRQRGL